MKSVLLINPRFTTKLPQLSISMGLMYVGSYLHSKGHKVNIIDANNFRKSKHFFDKIKYELGNALCVGLSVMTAQIPDALKIASYIRGLNASLPIIWGGVHPTLYPEQAAKDTLVDFVVKGEGEVTAFELIEAIEKHKDFSQVKGIAFSPNPNQEVVVTPDRELMDINKLPPIEWSLLEDIRNSNMTKIVGATTYEGGIPVQTSRGCPHRCTFCINTVLKSKYRHKEADRVLNDIKSLVDLGADRIFFIDDNFSVSKKKLIEILDRIERDKLTFQWFASCRTDYFREDHITLDLLKRMKRNGCTILGVGAESGSDRILSKLKKDATAEDTLNTAKLLSECGIRGNFSFMIGLPGEGKDDMEKTLKLIEEIENVDRSFRIAGPQIYRPYPGSLLYLECLTLGMKEPQTLAEWAASPYIKDRIAREDYDKYPWIEVPMSTMNDLLEYADKLMFYSYACVIASRSRIINKIVRKIARARCEKSYFKYPVEKMVYDAINKTVIGGFLSGHTGL